MVARDIHRPGTGRVPAAPRAADDRHAPATGHSRARRLASAAVLCTGLAVTPQAHAWGDAGHEIVASIAYARLHPAARRAADALLRADPDPLAAGDFVRQASWADKERDADRDTTRVRYEATAAWHFVDIEIDGGTLDAACRGHPALPPGTPASQGPARACIVDKVLQFRAELADATTPRAERLLALKYLLHLVGDLHQPLHTADHHDRGGNAVRVRIAGTATTSNLHAYWDSHLVRLLGPRPRAVGRALNRAITAAQARRWSAGGPADWAMESFELARSVAYRPVRRALPADGSSAGALPLDADDDAKALPVVRRQLEKAGVRLAALLDAALR